MVCMNLFIVAVGVYRIMTNQIYIRLCLYLALKRLWSQGYIGKYRIIVLVIMKAAVRTALVLVANVMKICFYERENSMNKRMIKALKDKCIYVDIDGTLAGYRFNNHVSAKDGTTNGQTMEEIENHVFLHSRPLKTVIKMLKKAKKRGIWICGAIISPIELLDKIVWLEKNCKGIEFNGKFWFVSEEYWDTFLNYFNCGKSDYDIVTQYGIIIKGSKNCMWDWNINHNFHKLEETVFIDDVLPYLKYAEERGVTAYHISSFIE